MKMLVGALLAAAVLAAVGAASAHPREQVTSAAQPVVPGPLLDQFSRANRRLTTLIERVEGGTLGVGGIRIQMHDIYADLHGAVLQWAPPIWGNDGGNVFQPMLAAKVNLANAASDAHKPPPHPWVGYGALFLAYAGSRLGAGRTPAPVLRDLRALRAAAEDLTERADTAEIEGAALYRGIVGLQRAYTDLAQRFPPVFGLRYTRLLREMADLNRAAHQVEVEASLDDVDGALSHIRRFKTLKQRLENRLHDAAG